MDKFDFNDIQPFLFLVMGMGVIAFSLFTKTKSEDLKLIGVKVEGIVFELSGKANSNTQASNIMDKVTIRFVTKNKEWITADINQEFAIFYTGQYKIGDKVDVYYDPQNPLKFLVDTKQSEQNARLIAAVVGIIFFIIGLYQIFITS